MCKQNTKPGKNGYKIIFNENMVVMNYKFAAAAAEYGTKEYKIMKGIRRDFPGMAEVVVSGRDKKTPHPNPADGCDGGVLNHTIGAGIFHAGFL